MNRKPAWEEVQGELHSKGFQILRIQEVRATSTALSLQMLTGSGWLDLKGYWLRDTRTQPPNLNKEQAQELLKDYAAYLFEN